MRIQLHVAAEVENFGAETHISYFEKKSLKFIYAYNWM